MAAISKRAQETQFSPIRKLKPLADRVRQRGIKIYNLNIGQPDIPTPAAFVAGMKKVPTVLAYSPSQGQDEARQALVGYYEDQGISISADRIIITTGGSEAITFAILAVTDPGDELLVPEPFYTNYNSYARMAGVQIRAIATEASNGFRLPQTDVIERLITPRTRALLFCNPGNPTGVVYTKEELRMLADVAEAHDLFLISDEVYREFVYDGLKHTSVLQLEGVEQNAILVDSISKRFSACGARIGAFISPNSAVMEAGLKFAQARLSPPTAGQLGLIAFLKSRHYREEVQQMIQQFERRRDVVHAELAAIPGVRCPKPQGAFYIIASLPVDDGEAFCRWLLTEFALNGETVMLAPAAEFYQTCGKGKSEVRIAYVLNEEALRQAMHILREGLAAYPGWRANS